MQAKSVMTNSQSINNFRLDINGLRAIAVLLVLFFHLFSFIALNDYSWTYTLNGGYVGVDIFFVISGFLMTAIIIKGLRKENFSIWNFWKRRAKRICPALLFAIVLFYIVGFFLLVNVNEFYEFNKEGTAALAFISNLRFAKDEGYFAVDSMSKMLLHTWSLSVEWQFYIVYPIILWLLNKFLGFRAVKAGVLVLFITSLFLSFILTEEKYYYLLQTRSWELLSGAIVFLFPVKALLNLSIKSKRFLEILGIIFIFSIFFREDNAVWTPLAVLPSVLGAMLIISLASEKSILSNQIFQYLGKISYSLYIYHWLVLSISARINLSNNFLLIGTVIFVLSIFSYHFIESSRNYGWKFLLVYLSCLGFTVFTVDRHGFKDRYSGIEVEFAGKGVPDFYPAFNNQKNKAEVVLIGDSHAQHLWPFFEKNNINLAIFSSSGTYCYDDEHCSFSKPNFVELINEKYGSIHKFVSERKNFIESFPVNTPIVISQRWTQHFNKMFAEWGKACQKDPDLRNHPQSELFDESLGKLFLENPNRHFYVLGSLIGSKAIYTVRECNNIKNYNRYLPHILLDKIKCEEPLLKYDNEYKNANLFLKNYLKKFNNVSFINPNDSICKNDLCRLLTPHGKDIFWDDNHLSVEGAEFIGEYIFSRIKASKIKYRE